MVKCKKMDNYKIRYAWRRSKDSRRVFEVINFSFYANPIFNVDEMHATSRNNLVDYDSPSLNSNYHRILEDKNLNNEKDYKLNDLD